MTAYTVIPGDIVDFIDPTTGTAHRGYVDEYRKGRDPFNAAAPDSLKRPFSKLRDYLVVFDEELWPGATQAWCAPEDLTIVRKAHNMISNVKVIDNTTATTSNVYYSGNSMAEKTDRFRPYYLTSRQFFDVLETAFNDTYGSDSEWHPEDLYANVEAVLEVTVNALTNAMRVKNDQPTRGVKDI